MEKKGLGELRTFKFISIQPKVQAGPLALQSLGASGSCGRCLRGGDGSELALGTLYVQKALARHRA